MDTVLITGGAGFIGIHTSISLLEKGFRVIIIDSLLNNSRKGVDRLKNKHYLGISILNSQLKFIKGDVRDINFLRKVFNKEKILGNNIRYVIHFAGLKSVRDSFLHQDLYWDVNVNGTKILTKVMEENGCYNLVFSSSATVYGEDQESPLNEQSKLLPNNPYGKTKLAAEQFLKDFSIKSRSPWKIICLRYFNPIGSHPSGNFGESPLDVPNNLFPYICQVANFRMDKLYIFGKDWPTHDGTCIRDYIHVMDLAEGHLASLKAIANNLKQSFIVINLGTGIGTSVLELIKTFESTNKLKLNYSFVGRRDGDKAIVFAEAKLAKTVLDWQARRNLVDMCRDGWKWQRKNPNGY